MVLKSGEKAPEVEAVDQTGKKIRLKDFRGKKIVLYFYPKDDTPGCTMEACSFRDDVEEIKKSGTVVLGVSMDDLESHKKFVEKFHLNFPLLVDDKAIVVKKYGALGSFFGHPTTKRITYVIDEKGIIRYVNPKVNPHNHGKEILNVLKNLS